MIGLRSYPDTVQRAVRAHPELGKAAPEERSMLSILPGNLLLFTAGFSVLGLGLFDLVVIDLLWWRNTKRIRFSFLPEKARYQDPGKHIGSFLRGTPLFAAVAALSAGIVTMLG